MFAQKFKGRKGYSSERSFSIMLAEELLRFELRCFYGDEIKIFRCDIEATKPRPVKKGDCENLTEVEDRFLSAAKERWIKIGAIIGPFEKTFEPSYEGDRRRNLRRVEAEVRLFSISSGQADWWKPHFLMLGHSNQHGEKTLHSSYFYESGEVAGRFEKKIKDNPCDEMCQSQTTANFPGIHNLSKLE
jgi:hypothetical protein